MGTNWTRDDDAALARLLVPVLGEAAVYEMGWRCERGHEFTDVARTAWRSIGYGDGCPFQHGETGGAYPNGWASVGQCGKALVVTALEPKDFSDPAVLWPLWERWDTEYDWSVTIYRERGDGFEASVWLDEQGRFRKGDTTTEAVARAWLAALEAEEHHGE